jgi:hypothetical protein
MNGNCYVCDAPGPHPLDEFGGHKCWNCLGILASMRRTYALMPVQEHAGNLRRGIGNQHREKKTGYHQREGKSDVL